VGNAKIVVGASLIESVLVNKPLIGELVAVYIVRRTELPVRRAWVAAGDAVPAPGPRPAHGVAHRNVDRVRRKTETGSDLHIDDLPGGRAHAAWNGPSVLVHDADIVAGRNAFRPGGKLLFRIGLREEGDGKQRSHPESQSN